MNKLNQRLATLAATVVIGATGASAQNTIAMDVTVPFAFTAGSNRVLPAGDYRIPAAPDLVWQIVNRGDSTTRFVGNGLRNYSARTDAPKLIFECREHDCALRQIQIGGGRTGLTVPAPKWSKTDAKEVRVIAVPMTSASE